MGTQDAPGTPDAPDPISAPEPSEPPSPPTADAAPARTRRLGRVGVAAVMVLCGVLFATTARLSGGGSIRDESSDVSGVLADRGRTIEQLTEDNEDKRAEIDALRDSSGAVAGEDTAALTDQVSDVVGLSEVEGPGLRITLTDAPSSALGAIPGTEPNDLVVHQQDLEAYINALWAGGAEAMMLQDQRVINGSAFRCAGNTLLLEGRVYSPPFVITVIGPVDEMNAALEEAPGVQVYREWVDYVGLGEKVEDLGDTTLPAYTGSLTLDATVPR